MSKKTVNAIKANLTLEISYVKDGAIIVVCRNTPILVDINSGIALIENDYVDVGLEEYQVISA